MIAIFTSLFITSALFCAGEDLPVWLTNDPALQHLLKDLLPMFGLGNAIMTFSTMSWTLLGSQGRYRLATIVVFITSWFITLPLAAVLTIHYRIDLEGQTAAMVVGYMLSGAIHSYFLFRSDWIALSEQVVDDNDSRISDDDCSFVFQTFPQAQDDAHETQGEREVEVLAETQSAPVGTSNVVAIPQRGNLPKPPSGRANGDPMPLVTGWTGELNDVGIEKALEVEGVDEAVSN